MTPTRTMFLPLLSVIAIGAMGIGLGMGGALARPDGAKTEPAMPQPPRVRSQKGRSVVNSIKVQGNGRTISQMAVNGGAALSMGEPGDIARDYVFSDIRMKDGCQLYTSTHAGAELSNSRFERIDAQDVCPAGLLRFRGRANNMLIEDVSVKVTGVTTSPGRVPAGIAFAGKLNSDIGEGIIFRRVYVSGVKSKNGRFLNGDGIATEAGYRNVRYEDVTVEDNIDSGIDNKATPATCSWVKSARNRRNFKFWYGVDCDGPVISVDPGAPGSGQAAHMQLFGRSDGTSVFHFADIRFRSDNQTPLIVNGTPKMALTVVIDRCTADLPEGTPTLWDPYKKVTVKFGPDCALKEVRASSAPPAKDHN